MKLIKTFVLFVFFISSFVCAFAQEPDLKIHFIDVGEGDSILIQAPSGETALIDAGNLVTGFRVLEYLKKRNIQSLDHLVFTHAHPDHIGGAFFILPMVEVKTIYDNAQDLIGVSKSFDIYRWYEQLVRGHKGYKTLKAKDNLWLGQINLNVLWPPQPFLSSDFNANSLVIMLKYGKFRCLLTGDLNIFGERKLLQQDIDLQADVLKVAHHGAADASSKQFLKSVSPKIAIISVDAANIRGYPAEDVVGRLKKAGLKLYRTDRDADVILSIRQFDDREPEIRVNK